MGALKPKLSIVKKSQDVNKMEKPSMNKITISLKPSRAKPKLLKMLVGLFVLGFRGAPKNYKIFIRG